MQPDITSRIQTLLQVKSGDLSIHVGDGLFTFAIDLHGNKSVQLKTMDLVRARDLFCRAVEQWRYTKHAEDLLNQPLPEGASLTISQPDDGPRAETLDPREYANYRLWVALSLTHEQTDKLVMNGINSLAALEGCLVEDLVPLGFTQDEATHILRAAGQIPATS